MQTEEGGGSGGASEEASWEMEEEEDRERKEEERDTFEPTQEERGDYEIGREKGENRNGSLLVWYFFVPPNPAAHLASD